MLSGSKALGQEDESSDGTSSKGAENAVSGERLIRVDELLGDLLLNGLVMLHVRKASSRT